MGCTIEAKLHQLSLKTTTSPSTDILNPASFHKFGWIKYREDFINTDHADGQITDTARTTDGKIVAVGFSPSVAFIVRYQDDGTIDTSFGEKNGVTTFDIPESTQIFVNVKPDGKIVVITAKESNSQNTLHQFTESGLPDLTFGYNGTAFIDNSDDKQIKSTVIQSDGRVVVAGTINSEYIIQRINLDGTYDSSFNNGTGKLILSYATAGNSPLRIKQRNDSLYLAGYQWTGGEFSACIAKISSDGVSDTSFGGGDGAITFQTPGILSTAYDVEIDNNGKIIMAGIFDEYASDIPFLYRFNSDGTPDTSFSGDGYAPLTTGAVVKGHRIHILSNGKIDLIGTMSGDVFRARFNSDGSIDSGYHVSGYKLQSVGLAVSDSIASTYLLPDDSVIIIGGGTDTNSIWVSFNLKSTVTAGFDVAYGSTGTLKTYFANIREYIFSTLVSSDGKIVSLLSVRNDDDTTYKIVQHNPDGSLDSSFGVGGTAVLTTDNEIMDIIKIYQTEDKKLLVHFHSNDGVSDYPVLQRYLPSGSVDTSFGVNGELKLDALSALYFDQMRLLADGGFYIAGEMTVASDVHVVVAKFLPSGSLDLSFGGGDGYWLSNMADNLSYVKGLHITEDSIYVSLNADVSGNMAIAAIKLDLQGVPDPSFGSSGILKFNPVAGKSYNSKANLVDESNRLVVLAETDAFGPSQYAAFRFDEAGNLDSSFGTAGVTLIDNLPAGYDAFLANKITLTSDGKILMVGRLKKETWLSELVFLRLNADGTRDTSFGNSNNVVSHPYFELSNYGTLLMKNDGSFLYTTDLGEDGLIMSFKADGCFNK
ncbi:hypothetical protein AZI85_12330 [Bdellovibrio bacteriovorus]|uniref:Uncharacterized protein n=1 Tax=Bdellovibrio bacteriovorus TaxID=959 RepID=A0A150WCY0_BDEBC|nr:hypothetical protein [Bdellovibrio bacteriovorus]KYG60769.1 hypothetical protein AZI85_12330 [Bdellovibrio bacteriovorus]